MSTTTNVILAAGPTLVAIAAIGSTVWQQRRSFEHDREMTDLADARTVLDEAAVALHDANYAMGDVRRALNRHDAQVREYEPEAIDLLRGLGKGLDALRERLTIRFGRGSAVVRTFAAADQAVLSTFGSVTAIDPADDDLSAHWRRIMGDRDDFEREWRAFQDAAEAMVGARGVSQS